MLCCVISNPMDLGHIPSLTPQTHTAIHGQFPKDDGCEMRNTVRCKAGWMDKGKEGWQRFPAGFNGRRVSVLHQVVTMKSTPGFFPPASHGARMPSCHRLSEQLKEASVMAAATENWITYLFRGVTVGPLSPAVTVHGHNDEQCWVFSLLAIAVALLSVLPLRPLPTHVFCESFLTSLSSLPSSSHFSSSSSSLVGSDCPAFLAFQLRMLEIPSSCCGLTKKTRLLFHPSTLLPWRVYIWCTLDRGTWPWLSGSSSPPRSASFRTSSLASVA